MNNKNRIFSFLLSLIMIMSVLFAGNCGVSANKLEFTNVTLSEDGVLTWDALDTEFIYYLHIDIPGKSYGYGIDLKTNSYDLHEKLYEDDQPGGTYGLLLQGKDNSGNEYEWKGTYVYEYVERNRVPDPYNFRLEGNILKWDHDYDNEAHYYLWIYPKGEHYRDYASASTTNKEVDLSGYFWSGTYDYEISIYASDYKSGLEDSNKVYTDLYGVKAESKLVSGIRYDQGILSWDDYPGATYYGVELIFDYYGEDKKVSSSSSTTHIDIANFVGKKPKTVKARVSAYRDVGQAEARRKLTVPADYTFEYKFDGYPFKVFGERVKDPRQLSDLLGDGGSVQYNATKNRLTFKYTEGSYDADAPLFETDSDVTVVGRADIKLKDAFIVAGGKLRFEEGCSIKATSEKKALISAGEVILYEYLLIHTPQNGRISSDKKTIVTSDGAPAGKIYIAHSYDVPYDATPTPTPTAAPTKAPTATAKPTEKPAAPTAKPAGVTTTTPAPTEVSADKKSQTLAFVERLYTCVLDREPEADGAAYWSDELYGFRRSGAEVAQGFIFSEEFENRKTSNELFVSILYKTFFNRDPDEDGMNYWLSQLSAGTMDRVTVANGFIYSQEWADTCASYGIRSGGDLKPTGKIAPTDLTYAFVERMYTTALGRSYDEEGKQYWAGELANFNVTGEFVGAAFFLSEEMNGYGLSNEEYLGRLYATFMNREPDLDGQDYWLTVMASGTPRAEVVFGFTRSAEFTEKCIEARILPY